jgi:ABC-type proline/glycine betaine transport system ATPase subunit
LPQRDILILDEPSEGLDPVNNEKVLKLLVSLAAQGKTIFFSSHHVFMPILKGMNIFNFMVGAGYLSNDNFLFNQPINSLGIALGGIVVIILAVGLGRVFKQMDM